MRHPAGVAFGPVFLSWIEPEWRSPGCAASGSLFISWLPNHPRSASARLGCDDASRGRDFIRIWGALSADGGGRESRERPNRPRKIHRVAVGGKAGDVNVFTLGLPLFQNRLWDRRRIPCALGGCLISREFCKRLNHPPKSHACARHTPILAFPHKGGRDLSTAIIPDFGNWLGSPTPRPPALQPSPELQKACKSPTPSFPRRRESRLLQPSPPPKIRYESRAINPFSLDGRRLG